MSLLEILAKSVRQSLTRMPSSVVFNHPARDEIVEEVVHWLRRAAASSHEGGVAARFDLRKNVWQSAYPETSGYLIATLVNLGVLQKNPSLLEFAEQIAEYLRSNQSADGAIDCARADLVTDAGLRKPLHVAFDLGAMLSGLCAVSEVNSDFVKSTAALASFLLSKQSLDGDWKGLKYFPELGSHNSLVGSSLLKAGRLLDDQRYIDGAVRTLEYLRPRIRSDGFITGCGFGDSDMKRTFIHPFCYAIEGFQDANRLVPGLDYPIEASLDRLVEMCDGRNLPPSHFDENFKRKSWYSAMTGIAQASTVLLRSDKQLHRVAGENLFDRLLSGIDVKSRTGGVRGGVQSSWPFHGSYGRFTYNNWGARYLLDAYLQLPDTIG